MSTQQHFSCIMEKQVNFLWDDDDEVCFVLDQHALLEFYSASSLINMDKHVTPLRHIIWFQANQSLLFIVDAAA
jgi:hypothetical protein